MANRRTPIKEEPEVLIVEHDNDEPEVFNMNQFHNDSIDDEDDTGASSSFTADSYDPERLAAYSISMESLPTGTLVGLNDLAAMEPETIISEGEFEKRKTIKNKESNAASMRDYRRRIRADPVRYELYKQRERVRNKKRCDLRRLQKQLATQGINAEMSNNMDLHSMLLSQKLPKYNSDTQDTFDVETALKRRKLQQSLYMKSERNQQRNTSADRIEISDSDADDDDEEGDDDDSRKATVEFPKIYAQTRQSIDTSLQNMFDELQHVASGGRRSLLPTKEISITIPKTNNSVLKQLPQNGIHTKLPEIDIFVRDPKTSERVPINGLPKSLTTSSKSQSATSDIVDLTSEQSDDDDAADDEDHEQFDCTATINNRLNRNHLEPQIEIVEYPLTALPPSSLSVFNADAASSSEKGVKRSSRLAGRQLNAPTAATISPSGSATAFNSKHGKKRQKQPAVTITPVKQQSKMKTVKKSPQRAGVDDNTPGYIDSFMTFVSRKMEEEERQTWASTFKAYMFK